MEARSPSHCDSPRVGVRVTRVLAAAGRHSLRPASLAIAAANRSACRHSSRLASLAAAHHHSLPVRPESLIGRLASLQSFGLAAAQISRPRSLAAALVRALATTCRH